MGLSPIMVDKIFEVVADIHGRGMTVLLVEQNASRALELADRGYVMESGVITMSGDGEGTAQRPEGARRLPGRVSSAAPRRGVGPLRGLVGRISRPWRRWP